MVYLYLSAHHVLGYSPLICAIYCHTGSVLFPNRFILHQVIQLRSNYFHSMLLPTDGFFYLFSQETRLFNSICPLYDAIIVMYGYYHSSVMFWSLSPIYTRSFTPDVYFALGYSPLFVYYMMPLWSFVIIIIRLFCHCFDLFLHSILHSFLVSILLWVIHLWYSPLIFTSCHLCHYTRSFTFIYRSVSAVIHI